MTVSGSKSTLLLAPSDEVVMPRLRAGARLHLPTLMRTAMRVHRRGPLRAKILMGTAWNKTQEEVTREAVAMVAVVVEVVEVVVVASTRKERGALRLSALWSKSLPNVVGAQVGGAREPRQQGSGFNILKTLGTARIGPWFGSVRWKTVLVISTTTTSGPALPVRPISWRTRVEIGSPLKSPQVSLTVVAPLVELEGELEPEVKLGLGRAYFLDKTQVKLNKINKTLNKIK